MRQLRCWWACGLLLAATANAQTDRSPTRPSLPPQADTNDPVAYYDFGLTILVSDPGKAAEAFRWASRMDPGWADPVYARRVALLLTDKPRLQRYYEGDRKTLQSREIRQIDSLQYRALMLSPFVFRKHDRVLLQEYFREAIDDISLRSGSLQQIDDRALTIFMNQLVGNSARSMRAWNAYNQGNLKEAVRLYGLAIKEERERTRSRLYAERARVHYLLGALDSANADLKLAIETLRKPEEKELVFFYESKALYEHSIGLILERQKDYAGAREAFGRALQEDLSFHPAHVATARVAMVAADTAAALAALDLAVQVAADDPSLRLTYALALRQARRPADAEAQLRKGIEIEPMFASLHFELAQTLEQLGNPAGALENYRAFLERASRRDPQRPTAERRVTALSGATPGSRAE